VNTRFGSSPRLNTRQAINLNPAATCAGFDRASATRSASSRKARPKFERTPASPGPKAIPHTVAGSSLGPPVSPNRCSSAVPIVGLAFSRARSSFSLTSVCRRAGAAVNGSSAQRGPARRHLSSKSSLSRSSRFSASAHEPAAEPPSSFSGSSASNIASSSTGMSSCGMTPSPTAIPSPFHWYPAAHVQRLHPLDPLRLPEHLRDQRRAVQAGPAHERPVQVEREEPNRHLRRPGPPRGSARPPSAARGRGRGPNGQAPGTDATPSRTARPRAGHAPAALLAELPARDHQRPAARSPPSTSVSRPDSNSSGSPSSRNPTRRRCCPTRRPGAGRRTS
jgi:hypothetical protein